MNTQNATKYAALAFLLAVGLGTIFTGLWDIIHNIPLPDYIKIVVSSGITYSLTALSLNHGANVALKGVENAQSGNSEVK